MPGSAAGLLPVSPLRPTSTEGQESLQSEVICDSRNSEQVRASRLQLFSAGQFRVLQRPVPRFGARRVRQFGPLRMRSSGVSGGEGLAEQLPAKLEAGPRLQACRQPPEVRLVSATFFCSKSVWSHSKSTNSRYIWRSSKSSVSSASRV